MGIIHCSVGKTSFSAEELTANLAALVDAINRAKPAGAKGQYLKTMTVASTMGPGHQDGPAGPPRGGRRVLTAGATGAHHTRRRSARRTGASPDNRIRRTPKTACARGPRHPTGGGTVGA